MFPMIINQLDILYDYKTQVDTDQLAFDHLNAISALMKGTKNQNLVS